MIDVHNKVAAQHLNRNAYLYIRQSTLKQLVSNRESAQRQYNLKDRATSLGWPREQIIVIDNDTGQSGAEAVDREGFQRMVAEVGMGHAGIVMGLEVSRLARNCADWHQLIEICGFKNTLILDEDGIYDPCNFNDRLLLGLKGTMSEAELHFLRARLRGGVLNKARRGALKLGLPVGFVYQGENVVLDPNSSIQESIRFFFKTFQEAGSAFLTVKVFREKGLKFPKRIRTGPRKGELVWTDLVHSRALNILHNPRYAGSFTYGRTRQSKGPDGRHSVERLPRDQWMVHLPESHPGYISYETFVTNEQQLAKNYQPCHENRRISPTREGPALLQGVVVCGVCGRSLTLRYHTRKDKLVPDYVCQSRGIATGRASCQVIPGAGIDEAIGKLLVKKMTPMALEVSVAVQKELECKTEEVKRLRQKSVDYASYEADLARRRYMSVDPGNRLVAENLEAEWNEKLRTLRQCEKECEDQCKKDGLILDNEQREEIFALTSDFPKLWSDTRTTDRDRKKMVRLLIEDVTLIKKDKVITVGIRFKGGATEVMEVPIALNYCMARKTPKNIVEEVDRLLDKHKDSEIATILNEKGLVTGDGLLFDSLSIMRVRRAYNFKSRRTRLIEKGLLTGTELCKKLGGISLVSLKKLKANGIVNTLQYGDSKSNILYEPLADQEAEIIKKMKRSAQKGYSDSIMQYRKSQEVQYEA